ncbi:MAG: nusB [Phycisphaerales bacterium]|nr:nusB [Phycisphaerales bacterium]
MQVLFLWDANGQSDPALARAAMIGSATAVELPLTAASPPAAPPPEPPDAEVIELAVSMALGAWENRAASDTWVVRLAPQWPPRRQPGVDRNILRLAVWEMTHADTPPKVVIDEAIEMAKRFSTENSPSFVNGVLDAVYREVQSLTAGGLPAGQ